MATLTTSGSTGRLQTRIGMALGALIVGLCVVLSLLLGEIGERRMVRLSAANLEVLTSQMARELSAGMYQFAKEVVNQTYRDRFRDPAASVVSMRNALNDFQRENPEVAHASIIDATTGVVLAATAGVFEGGSAAGRPVYEMGKKGLFYGDVHGAVRLAELLPRSANGEPLRFLDVSAPITDATGQLIRIFAVHIGWEWTSQLRDNVLGPVARRQDVELFLIDTDSKVVLTATHGIPVGTDLSTMGLKADQPPVKQAWADGADYLTAMSLTQPRGSFGGFGWRVVARQPYALTVASVRGMQYGFLAGGLAIGLIAALLAWQVTGRLVGPLRRLADQAEGVSADQGWSNSVMAQGETSDEVGEVLAVKRALWRLAQSARQSADASSTQIRQFEALAASLQQVVWQADQSGRLEYVNHDWIRAHKPEGDFFVSDFAALMPEEDRPAFDTRWLQARKDGSDLSCRCRLNLPPTGAPRWFEVQARSVRGANDKTERWVGTLFDIDNITSLAEATGRALEEEQAARLQADRSARIRDEFLATVSHELRSPLNAITGWSDILSRKRTDDPMIAKATESIRRNARHQAGLIDDLMDMTAVMAGKMVLRAEQVDLSQVARSVFLSHLPAAQEKGVALVCREGAGLVVGGESRRLEQVLSNLVGNAIKFTEAGGRVEVALEAVGEQVVLKVSDTGRGISSAFLPHVFDRMRQEDGSVTRRVGGLGLGLAIARGVVELHGGSIEAFSAGVGHGATFTVSLARSVDSAGAPVAETEQQRADALGHELEGLRVLLVDDEADAREVAHVALAAFGLIVRPVSSAAEAFQSLETDSFDLLVSDVGMPGMDGLTFMRKVRESDANWQSIPAVALTAFAMETDIRAGLAAGFHAYVAKPISLQRLYVAAINAMNAAKQLT